MTPVRAVGANVQTEPDGTFTFNFHVRAEGAPGEFTTEKMIVGYADVTGLLAQLQMQVLAEAEKRVRNTAAGDCETCRNFRMVEVASPTDGRPWTEHCPDCYDSYVHAVPSYPEWSGHGS